MLIDMLSTYYGMSNEEFLRLINNDEDKLRRFIYDYMYNNNRYIKIK